MPLIQFRRGGDAVRLATTLASGEPFFTTDTHRLYIGDNNLLGGYSIAGSSGVGNVYIAQATQPSAPPGNQDAFWFNTATNQLSLWKVIGGVGAWQPISVGPQGPAGGPQGPTGAAGNTLRSGGGAPANTLGADGDWYINTADLRIYGPKAAGAWPTTGTLIVQGPRGTSVLSGEGGPTSLTGVVGDFYFQTNNSTMYGPKGTAGWPSSGTSLIGPPGQQGSTGNDGRTIHNGPSNPTTEGIDGDFFLNTTTNTLYGPRLGSWPTAGTSIIGPTGATGARGSLIHYGNEPPSSTFPQVSSLRDGDFYLDVITRRLYGGYVAANSSPWGAGVSLVGSTGPAGPSGLTGPPGAAGSPGLVWRGVYQSGTTYPLNSVVHFSGSSYVVTNPTGTTNAPSNAADWNLVAQQGSTANAVATIYANSPIVWDVPTTTLSFSVPNASVGNVLRYSGTAWEAAQAAAARSIQTGAGAPDTNTVGQDGDWYIQTGGAGAPLLWGPRTTTNAVVSWGTAQSLVGPSGSPGSSGPQGPGGVDGTPGMEWNGEWLSTTNYSKGAVVSYNGSIYIAEQNNVLDTTPVTTAQWDLLVTRGEQGEPAGLVGNSPVLITSDTVNEITTFTVGLVDGKNTGEVFTWDDTSKAWVLAMPVASLDALSDVTITAPVANQALVYNGTDWVNGGDLISTLDSLEDVVLTTPTTNQVLLFNGTVWENASTVLEIVAPPPLVWDNTTSTLSLIPGNINGDVLTWNATTSVWEASALPPLDITAALPLYWDSVSNTMSFGVSGNAGDVLIHDGVNWIAGAPYDHTRPTVLWGDGPPEQNLGNSGDFYFDTANDILYGPKCNGCLSNRWTELNPPLPLVGPRGFSGIQGIQGPPGPQGPVGAQGNTGQSTSNLIRSWYVTSDPPNPLTEINNTQPIIGASDGDFLLVFVGVFPNYTSIRWYGRRVSGFWAGINGSGGFAELKGTQGVEGVAGPTGLIGPAGPQSGQLIRHSSEYSSNSVPATPSVDEGMVGDFHITTLYTPLPLGEYIGTFLFGAKTSDATSPWPPAQDLRGAPGPVGATGPQGPVATSTQAHPLGGLVDGGTVEVPLLSIRLRYGSGLVLTEIDSLGYLEPNLPLSGALASINNEIVVLSKPVNAAYRRSWFGI